MNPRWTGSSSSYHLILVCVNYDLNGSLLINSRLHARLNNQLSHPIPDTVPQVPCKHDAVFSLTAIVVMRRSAWLLYSFEWPDTVVCKKIAAGHEKAQFGPFLVETLITPFWKSLELLIE